MVRCCAGARQQPVHSPEQGLTQPVHGPEHGLSAVPLTGDWQVAGPLS